MQPQEQHIDYKELYEQQLAVIETQGKLIEQQLSAIERERNQITALSAELAQLRRMIFGTRTERFVPAADATKADLQLALDLSAETVAECEITSATTVEYIRTRIEVIPAKPKVHPGRMKLPEHLRQVRAVDLVHNAIVSSR